MADPDTRLDEMIARLRDRGYRLTPQRGAVLKYLAASEEHPSVEDIYRHVKKEFPMTSLATIYKTVTVLKEIGEVMELSFGVNSRYDGKRPYPHPHLICIKCHNIIDADIGTASELPQELSQKTGYRIVSHRLDFFGICPCCQKKE